MDRRDARVGRAMSCTPPKNPDGSEPTRRHAPRIPRQSALRTGDARGSTKALTADRAPRPLDAEIAARCPHLEGRYRLSASSGAWGSGGFGSVFLADLPGGDSRPQRQRRRRHRRRWRSRCSVARPVRHSTASLKRELAAHALHPAPPNIPDGLRLESRRRSGRSSALQYFPAGSLADTWPADRVGSTG